MSSPPRATSPVPFPPSSPQEQLTARAKAVIENPALADWFFYHRLIEFVKVFYTGVLGATDYWLRFEWQHRGSPNIHGLAWLPDTPDVEQLRDGGSDTLHAEIIRHADQLVSTTNPAVLPDGATLLMHQHQRLTPTSATRHMGTSTTLTRTSLILWPPARDTPAALPPTASAQSMASRSAALATPSLCNHTQPSSQRTSQLSSQLGTMG